MTMEDRLHNRAWGEGILAPGKEIPRMHCPCKPERCRQEMVLWAECWAEKGCERVSKISPAPRVDTAAPSIKIPQPTNVQQQL